MLIPGHLAVAYRAAAGRARRFERAPSTVWEVWPALLGSLTPDLLDKPLRLIGYSAYGRTIGHSFVFLLGCVALWAIVRRGRPGASAPLGMWVVGIASHLAADFADDFVRGILTGSLLASSWASWPFGDPDSWDVRSTVALLPAFSGLTPLEISVVGIAIVVALRTARQTR